MKKIVKVCGMTEARNIREVEQLGVDMMGFIFYPKSPRCLCQMPEYLPVAARRVGIFVDESKENILMYADRFGLNYIQLHGKESPAYCRSLRRCGLHLIKAFPVAQPKDLRGVSAYDGLCDYYQRSLYILVAFVGSLLFIITFHLLIELLDHTLRDPIRSKRLTGLPVIAAFNGTNNLKFRGFLKACNRIAAAYSCRRLNKYIQPDRPTVISLLSMETGEGKSYLGNFFASYWETEGLNIRIVKAEVDFDPSSAAYVNAQQLSDFWQPNQAEPVPNIILVEYPAINTASIPLPVLHKADVNVLVANACRLWRNSDNTTLQYIKTVIDDAPLYLYLNNADREVVESFTGELPPQTPTHSLFSRLAQLGLTAKQAAIK